MSDTIKYFHQGYEKCHNNIFERELRFLIDYFIRLSYDINNTFSKPLEILLSFNYVTVNMCLEFYIYIYIYILRKNQNGF